jgi:hypothetical protein
MPEIDMGNGNQFDATNGGITQDEHDNTIAITIEMRETEVYQYQVNINNYQAALDGMPKEPWPQRLLPYRGMARDQLAAAIESDEDLMLASQLALRDEVRFRLRTEKMEQAKSKMLLDSIMLSVPDQQVLRARILRNKEAKKNTPAG